MRLKSKRPIGVFLAITPWDDPSAVETLSWQDTLLKTFPEIVNGVLNDGLAFLNKRAKNLK